MIVDISDRDHLYKEILKDYTSLVRKQELILKKIYKILKKKVLKDDYEGDKRPILYNTPKNKTLWQIFYRIYKGTKVKDSRFVCIHKHLENDLTYYIVIDSQHNDEVFLQLFNPHFMLRFVERSGININLNETGVAQFVLQEGFRHIEKWEDSVNETQYYQITKWGLSLGNFDEEYKVFDNKTFVSKKELFEDQNQDLKQHFLKSIKTYDSEKYQLFIKYWEEYQDPLEMMSNEMWSFKIGQSLNPATDFFNKKIIENFKKK